MNNKRPRYSQSTSMSNKYGNKKDPFLDLPDEVILEIFKLLPRSVIMLSCALVCKRWNKISCDSSLWTSVDLSGIKNLEASVLERIISYGVKNLTLIHTKVIQCHFFSPFTNNFYENSEHSMLQCLNLDCASIKLPALEKLLSVCFYLKELHLSWHLVNDVICRKIADIENLRILNMRRVEGITQSRIRHILQNSTRLEELNLCYTKLSDVTWDVVSQTIPSTVVTLKMFETQVQDEHIKTIIDRCPNLLSLNIGGCVNLTSDVIDFIIHGLLKIKSLDLSFNEHFHLDKIFSLENIPSLKQLYVYGLGDSTFIKQIERALKPVKIIKICDNNRD